MIRSISFGRAAALAVLAASAVACGPRNFVFEGDWVGKKTIPIQPGANPDIIETARTVKLNVKGDRFDLLNDAMPLSGVLSVSGNDATLTVDSEVNQPLNRTSGGAHIPAPVFKLKVQPDHTVLFIDAKGDPGQVVTLHRIATGPNDRP